MLNILANTKMRGPNSYWMSGFVDIIYVAKCPIDKTMTWHFFVKLSMPITQDLWWLTYKSVDVCPWTAGTVEACNCVLAVLYGKINYAYNKQYISPAAACVPVPWFPIACVPVHFTVVSGLCNILKFLVQRLSNKLDKFMHTSAW
jgi:hypothetical protein